MADTLLHRDLNYENKWIRLREEGGDNQSPKILLKEIRQEFINSAESWKKERRLKNLLDTILHLEESSLTDAAVNQKAYHIPRGSSLLQLIEENQMTMPERLRIASEIIHITLELHAKGYLFCDLNPNLFWCDLIDEKTYLVDTIMTVHTKDVAEFYSTIMGIEPHMLCMSPEQSPQTSWIPDFRSNYYSLGIILYALFTGKYPLQSPERISTIHKHLSQLPPDPRSVNKHINRSMGAFILKLLSKDPRDRFQSPTGLLFDFRKCKSLQLNKDVDTVFELGNMDFPTQFTIPDSVFVRKQEHDILIRLSEKVLTGAKHLVMLKGEEGSGSSYLIESFFRDLDYDGFFIGSGTYSHRDTIPFKGLKDLTADLLHQILMEDPLYISKLKGSMQESIGSISGVLIDFEKDFQHLFDSCRITEDLFGNAAINRFIYAYTEFLRLLQLQGKSIIISLERFELTDVGTARLLAQLLKSSHIQNILIVISVNKDEGAYNANCIEFLEGLENQFEGPDPINITEITLKNYDPVLIEGILESLRIEPLAEFGTILYEKTRGNLSFIKQLFEELISQDYIKANIRKKTWEVDIQAVQNIDLSDNVKDFLKNRIDQLSDEEHYVLRGAMSMGQNIDVRQLHHILSFDEEKVEVILNGLRQKGFLTPVEYENARLSRMKFSHSGFAEILLESMGQQELERFKLDLVKMLFKELNEDQIASRIYELVAHIMPLRPENCREYIGYLEKAAHKAKKEAAFDNASQYFAKLLSINRVRETADQEVMFTHAYEAALCALYAMKYTDYQSLLGELAKVVSNKNQGYHIYILKAIETVQRGNHEATLKVLQEGLQAMGIKFSLDISKAEIIKMFFLNIWRTRNLKADNVEGLPYSTDKKQAIYQSLISISSPAVYFLKPELTARLTYLGIRDTLKKGVIPQSPNHLVSLGFNMNNFTNMVTRAHVICRAGFKLMESKLPNSEVSILVNFLYSAFVQHTEYPLRDCIAALEDYYRKGRELGNINIAHYCLGMARWYLLFDGYPLARLSELVDASHQLCLDDNQKIIDSFHRTIKTLLKELTRGHFSIEALDDSTLPLSKGVFTEAEISDDRLLPANLKLVKLIVYTGNNQICQDKELLTSLLQSTKEGGHGTINAIYHIFYALLHILQQPTARPAIPKSEINKYLGILKVRSKVAPFTYRVKYLLLSGLQEVQEGRPDAGKRYFSEACISALEYDNPWDKALSYELYGAHLIAHGIRRAGFKKMAEAVDFYREWGALSIVNRITRQFPELEDLSPGRSPDAALSPAGDQGGKNFNQLIRLSRAIYEQDDLNKLVIILLDSIMEEPSVERAVFIIKNDLDFSIYASKTAREETEIQNTIAGAGALPLTLLRLVERRRIQLVIGNAYQNSQYRSDPYIQEKRIRSVLCIPFVRSNQTKSLIYLENSQLENAFDFINIDLINLMYSQVAIAMDNSILTELLEDKLQQRSFQITQERDKADELLKNILPAKVAEELKVSGNVKARKYDNVSVLFTDFKDFSLFSEKLTADQIIDELHRCFKAFDTIVEEFGLEKIKTIGDAYMCAGGISEDSPTHEYDIVRAGLKMLAYIEESNYDRVQRGIPPLHLREGIHSGPVIAGVVGIKKYAFDIWGPTVNIASRMESSGEPGMLNISGTMYLKVKDRFSCVYRGKISAKNVGEIDMYFVEKKR